jgi:signal transduction histidine kinase
LIAISAARAGDSVAIMVRDNGSGIEDAILPHLFEPFFTTKTDVGTGLGLWVSKGIVEKHRGSIAVISSIDPADHGTAITVALPMAEAMAAR